tara:strand:+ start:362 stop:1279 length:918 start_codon:yes stop_codon:yes gene_type:complete
MYYNRNLIGADKSAVTPRDASGIFDLRSQEKHQRAKSWPGSTDNYLIYTINYSGTPFEVRQVDSRYISIDWGDGSSEVSNTNSVTHTYSANGIYEIKINTTLGNIFYRPRFDNVSSDIKNQLIKVETGRYLLGSLDSSFRGCTNLEEIIAPYTSFSSVTTFRRTFRDCTSLKVFPFIETKTIANFENFCWGLNLLTTFPALDFSAASKFNGAWYGCTSLAHFPPNMFDKTGDFFTGNNFTNAWTNCALTAQSIENILVSLDTNGDTGIVLSINSGSNAAYSTWSQAAKDALTSLQGKSWTVAYNS